MSSVRDTDFLEKMNAINAATASTILNQLYHVDAEFIDPVKRIHGCANLITYFEDIYAGVQSCHFELLGSISTADKSSLEWEMRLRHKTLAPKRDILLNGVSVLHYRQDLIHYQRDYYDLGAMVYEQIPILGAVIRKIKGQI
ncbi:MAG: nuclear transport factor 2 family protein [Gammaproteobacteria bacterium]|jgi:hypothetical protein|nr:nuclear transport factor 2 family protein [Gammaproteobacteria bacterium]|tara:strand:+ start:25054 stop:25479 length:426 start_codon:yes stop_codon:yes gene_type:complete